MFISALFILKKVSDFNIYSYILVIVRKVEYISHYSIIFYFKGAPLYHTIIFFIFPIFICMLSQCQVDTLFS